MDGTPACPNCGNTLFVRPVSTGGIFFGHSLEDEDLHRCYRCVHSFSPGEENGSGDAEI